MTIIHLKDNTREGVRQECCKLGNDEDGRIMSIETKALGFNFDIN